MSEINDKHPNLKKLKLDGNEIEKIENLQMLDNLIGVDILIKNIIKALFFYSRKFLIMSNLLKINDSNFELKNNCL